MVTDWTTGRKAQLRKLQELLNKVEMVDPATGAVTDILQCSAVAKELLYKYDDSDGKTFWNFLVQELNKE